MSRAASGMLRILRPTTVSRSNTWDITLSLISRRGSVEPSPGGRRAASLRKLLKSCLLQRKRCLIDGDVHPYVFHVEIGIRGERTQIESLRVLLRHDHPVHILCGFDL